MTDFGAWARPGLELTLGGKTYTVPPPSVDRARLLLALAVRGEVNLGLVKGEVPADVQKVLDRIGPDDHPALTEPIYQQLVDDGVDPVTINRMAYYAVFYWARSEQYADTLAALMWTPREIGGDRDGPKAQPTSPPKTGRGTGSASRSTTTKTASPSSPTTASPSTS